MSPSVKNDHTFYGIVLPAMFYNLPKTSGQFKKCLVTPIFPRHSSIPSWISSIWPKLTIPHTRAPEEKANKNIILHGFSPLKIRKGLEISPIHPI